MDTPRISVIIPVYNGEKTIRETIESVLNQTFTNFELLVINDGSQDSTLNIVADIQDPRLKSFSYSNAGISASRNRGIALARGEFVAFLDADDLWTSDKLETQLKTLEANPQAAVVYSWTEFINETGRLIGVSQQANMIGDVYTELLKWNYIPGSASSVLVRKQVFNEVGGFDERLTYGGEDWDMWLRLAAHYHFVAVTTPQVLYRVTNYSMSSNISRQEMGSLKVIEQAFAHAPISLQYLKRHSLAQLYKYLASRVIYGSPGRQNGLMAIKFLCLAFRYNPLLFLQVRFVVSKIFKITAVILFSSQQVKTIRTLVRSIKNSNYALKGS